MFDVELVQNIFKQILQSIQKIEYRFSKIKTSDDLTNSAEGMEKLDSICMQFIAIGESLKNIDKITDCQLLIKYQNIDWKGVMGFRDIITHHYFDVDADEVFWICKNEIKNLEEIVQKIINDLQL